MASDIAKIKKLNFYEHRRSRTWSMFKSSWLICLRQVFISKVGIVIISTVQEMYPLNLKPCAKGFSWHISVIFIKAQ